MENTPVIYSNVNFFHWCRKLYLFLRPLLASDLICRSSSFSNSPTLFVVFKTSLKQRPVRGKLIACVVCMRFKGHIICLWMPPQSQMLMYIWRNALNYITLSWLPDSTTKIIKTQNNSNSWIVITGMFLIHIIYRKHSF